MSRTALLIAASLVAAGCIPQPRTTEPPRVTVIETVETDADRLLQYYAYIVALQGDNLENEYRRVLAAFDEHPDDFNRMRLVLLLASPSATFRDNEKAHTLLKGWLDDPYNEYSKLRPLALMFANHLAEIRRMTESQHQTGDKLKKAGEEISRLTHDLEAEKQRAGTLRSKLDALLELEKNLIEREPKNQESK